MLLCGNDVLAASIYMIMVCCLTCQNSNSIRDVFTRGFLMNLGFTQSLQLQQTLKTDQVMIQRFNVLQQTANEFKETIQENQR